MGKKYEFWISNITDMNVCLRDLSYTIPARASKNLLDDHHFHYTKEQLEKSATSGSLYKKRDRIKIRKVPPLPMITRRVYLSKQPLFITQNPLLSRLEIKEPIYEELKISETEIADEITNEDSD